MGSWLRQLIEVDDRDWVRLLVWLLFFALVLRVQPLWTMGLYQDDAVISSYRFDAMLQGKTLWGYSVDMVTNLLRFQGRIAPLFGLVMTPLQAAIGDNVFLYRVVTSGSQLLALACFFAAVKVITRSTPASFLSAVVFVSVFEVRDFHDPSHSYFILLPYLISVGCLACWFVAKSNESERHFDLRLYMAAMLNLAGMLMYEMAVPLAAVSCLVLLLDGPFTFRVRFVRAVIAGSPVVIVMLAGLTAKAFVSQYEGTKLGNLAPAAVYAAYVKHVSAAIPLSYWWNDPHHYFGGLLADTRSYPAPLLGGAILGLVVGFATFVAMARMRLKVTAVMLASGAVLALLPALLVSVSLKYQKEAVMGVGYLHNSLSYLGTSMLIVAALAMAVDRLRRYGEGYATTLSLLASCAMAAVAAISLLSSYRVAAAVNQSWRYPREQLETWMSATRPQDSHSKLIVMDRGWLNRWEWPPFMLQHWGVRGRFTTVNDLKPTSAIEGPDTIFLRTAGKVDPRGRALFVDLGFVEGRRRIRGIVMSVERDALAGASLALVRGNQAKSFDGLVRQGRHGYFYREAIMEDATGLIGEYGLIVGGSAPQNSSAPASVAARPPVLEWTRGHFNDGWAADQFELRNSGSGPARIQLSLWNATSKPRGYEIEGVASRIIHGKLAGDARIERVISLDAGQSLVGRVSPAYIPRDEGIEDDRHLGLRIQVEALH